MSRGCPRSTPITNEMIEELKSKLTIGSKIIMIDTVEKRTEGKQKKIEGVVTEKYNTFFLMTYKLGNSTIKTSVRYNDFLVDKPTAKFA